MKRSSWKRRRSARIKPLGARARRYKGLRQQVREIAILRDGQLCRRCRKTRVIQAAHIYPEGKYRAMAHWLPNIILLCVGCHRFWWHLEPIAAAEWVRGELGDEHMEALAEMARSRVPTRPVAAIQCYLDEQRALYLNAGRGGDGA